MTRKKAKKTKKIVHARWTEDKMTLHLKSYCNDAKEQYLDADSYKKATARLTTRTGWKIRELEGRLAASSFKACKGNRVLVDPRAREEVTQVGLVGGLKGARAKAVWGMREVLQTRVGGSENPVVTFAMLLEWRDNKRDLCGGAKDGVTAAIFMAAAQEGMKVEMFEVGCGGKRERDGVEEAQQWAVKAGWIGQPEAAATLAAWQELALRRGETNQHILIEMGVGWNGATEGFQQVFDRVVGIDRKRQKIAKGNKSQPDFLSEGV